MKDLNATLNLRHSSNAIESLPVTVISAASMKKWQEVSSESVLLPSSSTFLSGFVAHRTKSRGISTPVQKSRH
jgi:hypothetical protein